MMQEARKARARESLRQCPVCGNPHSLSIDVKEDKWTGRKSAHIRCSSCGFEATLEDLPPIADEFWIYSKVLDMVQGEVVPQNETTIKAEETVTPTEEVKDKESALEVEIEELKEQ